MDAAVEHKRDAAARIVRLFTVVNLALAGSALVAWQAIAPYLADPLAEATGIALSHSRPDWTNPAYALVWLAPILAIVLANLSITAGQYRLARWVAAYPLLLIGMAVVWFVYFSAEYR